MPRKPVVSRSMKVTQFVVHFRIKERGLDMTRVDHIPRWYIDKPTIEKYVRKNWADTGFEITDITDIKLGTASCTMTEQEYLDRCTITNFEEFKSVTL